MRKVVFTSYSSSPEYTQPEVWLNRIRGYTGILEHLNKTNKVIGIERINYQGEYEQNGVRYLFIRLNRKVVRFPFRMHRLIRELQPDVVFVNGFIFPLQMIQLRLKLGRAAKIIILHRAEKPFKGVKRYLQKLADQCVDAYLFTSSEFGKEWKRNINVGKIHEVIQASSIFYTMDKAEARKLIKIKGDPVFLWIGMLIPRKDPLTAVKAFLAFVKYQPGAKLYMIYQSSELLDEISALLADDKHRQSIVLVGKIPHDELQYWFNSADFFISTSHYEGSGVALSEAMSCGCIPVTTDFISFKTMTGPGKCGLLFEPGNATALTEALLQTREMDLYNERQKVLRQFKAELSFEAIAGKIDQLITSLKPAIE